MNEEMADQCPPDPLYTLRGDMGAVHSLCFELSNSSECVYASTQVGIIHKWDLKTCRETYQFESSQEACLAVKLVGKYLVSQTKGGEIKIWEEVVGNWNLKTSVNLDHWGFCKFDFSSENCLVCPQSGSTIKIIDLEGKTVNTIVSSGEKCGEIMVVKCVTLAGTDYILVIYESGLITLFKSNGIKVNEFKVSSDCPMTLDFDGESKGVVGTSGDVIQGFEITLDLEIVKGKQAVVTNPGVSCVAIRPDRKLFAAGCWDAAIRLFSMKNFKLLVVLINHKDTIQDICYSASSVDAWNVKWLLAAAGKDGRITLWDLY